MRFWQIRCLMPPRAPLPAARPCAVEPRSMFRPTRAIQIDVFKDGHPNLVGLPSPVPNRFPTVSRRFHLAALTQASALSSTEPVTRRRFHSGSPVPVTPEESPRIFAVAVWWNRAMSRFERAFTDAPRVDGPWKSSRSA